MNCRAQYMNADHGSRCTTVRF